MTLHIFILTLNVLCILAVNYAIGHKTRHQKEPEDRTIIQSKPPNILSDGEINATLSEEKRLLRFLIKRYQLVGKSGPPVINSSEPVTVKFGLGLIKLDLDEKTKMLVTSMWTRYIWRDMYMVWNPEEFNGIRSVRIESQHVWLPDVVLYNDVGTHVLLRDAQMIVSSDGVINWYPQQTFRSSCNMNMQDFPFDQQKCSLLFGSWTYAVSQLDIAMAFEGGLDISTFQSDNKDVCEWNIVKHSGERKELGGNGNDKFAVFTIELHLQRKVTFTTYILTMPCVFLASLTLAVFWLPANGTDRTGLSMGLFGSFLLLLLILVETAPPTSSSMPKLGLYYCFNMILVIISILLSSLVVNVHQAGEDERRVPNWLRVITIEFLGKLICVTWNGNNRSKGKTCSKQNLLLMEKKVPNDDQYRPSNNWNNLSEQRNTFYHTCSAGTNETNSDYAFKANTLQMCDSLRRLLYEGKGIMEQIRNEKAQKEEAKQNADEWKMVAKCLDRLFFFVYFVSIVLSLIYLFPSFQGGRSVEDGPRL